MKTKKLQNKINKVLAAQIAELESERARLEYLLAEEVKNTGALVAENDRLHVAADKFKEGTDIWIARDNRFGTYAYHVQPKLTPDGLYLCAVPQELPSVNFNCTVWEHLVKTNECKKYKLVEVPE